MLAEVLIPVATTFLGGAIGFFGDRLRYRYEDRRHHLEAIRSTVLRPTIQRIEAFCLPVALGKAAPIEEVIEQVPVPFGTHDPEQGYRRRWVPMRPEVRHSIPRNSEPYVVRDPAHGKVDDALRRDVNERHFPALWGRYEEAEQLLTEFQTECITYCDNLLADLVLKCPVPLQQDYRPQSGFAPSITLFILLRQLGTSNGTMSINESTSGLSELIGNGGTNYARGTREEMAALLKLIQNSIEHSPSLGELMRRREWTRERFTSVVQALKEAAAQERLPNSCQFA